MWWKNTGLGFWVQVLVVKQVSRVVKEQGPDNKHHTQQWKTESSSFKIRRDKARILTLATSFNRVSQVLARIRQEEGIKGIHIRKEGMNLYVCR